jgi:hypothetical protein
MKPKQRNVDFWQTIKNVNPLGDHRVILFCSYGSPTDVVKTPIIVHKPQRISLQPMDDPAYAPVGLLLTREEYEDLIDNWSLRSKLDDSLLETILTSLRATSG